MLFLLILVFVLSPGVRAYFWTERRQRSAHASGETEVRGAAPRRRATTPTSTPTPSRGGRSALFLEIQRRWSANDVAGLEPLSAPT